LKTAIDGTLLTAPNFIDSGLHIVVDPSLGHTAKHTEGVIVRIKQHLVSLG